MSFRILLFDDDYESMEPLMSELEERGFKVDLTADEQVLDRLSTTKYALICADFMIHPQSPGHDSESIIDNVHFSEVNWQRTGQEFLRRLRSGEYVGDGRGTPADVPTIIISATAKSADDYGEAAFFEKPFDPEEVVVTIHNLLRFQIQPE